MSTSPSWASRALAASWDLVQSHAPASLLPKLDHVRSRRGSIEGRPNKYGCGAFGCVFETNDPGWVCKVTTDASEAAFAKEADGDEWPFVVRYRMVIGLKAKHEGRPIFLLWREAAERVGEEHSAKVEKAIQKQHTAAGNLLLALDRGEKPVKLFDTWAASLGHLGEVAPELEFVANGMLEAATRRGIAILDIHGGNLGVVTRNGKPTWVIVDPGHVVNLSRTSSAKRNPAGMPRSEAVAYARTLLLDKDPASLDILMDIAREQDKNAYDFLIDISEQPDPDEETLYASEGVFDLGVGRFDTPMALAWRVTPSARHIFTATWNGQTVTGEVVGGHAGGELQLRREAVALALLIIRQMKETPKINKPTLQLGAMNEALVGEPTPQELILAAEQPRQDGEVRVGDLIEASGVDNELDLNKHDLAEVLFATAGRIDVFVPDPGYNDKGMTVQGMKWPSPNLRLVPMPPRASWRGASVAN